MKRLFWLGLLTGSLSAAAQPVEAPTPGAAALQELDEALAEVSALETTDADQAKCVAPKQEALQTLRDVSVQIHGELLEALAADLAQHASLAARKLEIARVKGRQLRAEAAACLPTSLTSEPTVFFNEGGIEDDTGETDGPELEVFVPDPPSSSQFE
jgi:hypothetical protein